MSGHKANKYLNRRTIIALNDGGYQTEDELRDTHEEEIVVMSLWVNKMEKKIMMMENLLLL